MVQKKTREDFQNEEAKRAERDLMKAGLADSKYGGYARGEMNASLADLADKADDLRARGEYYEPKTAKIEPRHWLIIVGIIVALIVVLRFLFY